VIRIRGKIASWLRGEHEITKLDIDSKKIKLFGKAPGGSEVELGAFDRVILGLPKCALQKVAYRNLAAFGRQEGYIADLLDSTFAFPMVKVFVVGQKSLVGKREYGKPLRHANSDARGSLLAGPIQRQGFS
jgi:hypothetical protein